MKQTMESENLIVAIEQIHAFWGKARLLMNELINVIDEAAKTTTQTTMNSD